MTDAPRLATRLAAELFGTFVLVFFGCGSVHCAVLVEELKLFHVAAVWGIAVMLAVYSIGGVSGAHINPAVTCGLAAWNLFPRRLALPYVASQVAGAFLAAAALFVLFGTFLDAKEHSKSVRRGELGSVITAMCYGEYFPNPGSLAGGDEPFSEQRFNELQALVSEPVAFFAELLGTAILGFVVVGLSDARNPSQPEKLSPTFIGLTVTVLICVIAPLTQACFNPARDFGPRLFAYLAGWDAVAIPGPNGRGMVTVYIVAPISGAIVGMGLYQFLFRGKSS